jgi:hypothetical protein
LYSSAPAPVGKKRRMEIQCSARIVSIERQREEYIRRHPRHTKPLGMDEAEALIITRMTAQAAAARAGCLQAFKPCPYERRADALALQRGQHGKRTRAVPVGRSLGERDGRKGDVPDHFAVQLRDGREAERALRKASLMMRLLMHFFPKSER